MAIGTSRVSRRIDLRRRARSRGETDPGLRSGFSGSLRRTPTPLLGAEGFTLLEVLVALAVVATALVALLSLHARNLAMVASDQRLARATLLAQEVLTRTLVENPFPEPSEDSGTFADFPDFSWRVRVLPGPSEDLEETLREIQVRVFWDASDPDAVLLITHVRKPDA
jgi:general secretion pathway protein I